jgi:hypothetical protein
MQPWRKQIDTFASILLVVSLVVSGFIILQSIVFVIMHIIHIINDWPLLRPQHEIYELLYNAFVFTIQYTITAGMLQLCDEVRIIICSRMAYNLAYFIVSLMTIVVRAMCVLVTSERDNAITADARNVFYNVYADNDLAVYGVLIGAIYVIRFIRDL